MNTFGFYVGHNSYWPHAEMLISSIEKHMRYDTFFEDQMLPGAWESIFSKEKMNLKMSWYYSAECDTKLEH